MKIQKKVLDVTKRRFVKFSSLWRTYTYSWMDFQSWKILQLSSYTIYRQSWYSFDTFWKEVVL